MTEKVKSKVRFKWDLMLYDILVFILSIGSMMVIYKQYLFDSRDIDIEHIFINGAMGFFCIFVVRFVADIYKQIWRYGGVQCYIKMIIADGIGSAIYLALQFGLYYAFDYKKFPLSIIVAFLSMNLILSLTMRMMYRYCYKCSNNTTKKGKLLSLLLKLFSGQEVRQEDETQKIKVAIVGAGSAGVALAENLMGNKLSSYIPRIFIDENASKVGRQIHGIPVFSEDSSIFQVLKEYKIQEIILALPRLAQNRKKELYDYYKQSGCKIKVYDYPSMESAGSKRRLREFDIEDLLFREPIKVSDEKTKKYYRDKIVLITGGGGSIGSELCRQLAKLNPKQIIILDIYENGVYDVQQELKFKYGDKLDLKVEIASITNRTAMARVFETYKPDIVINAAAHKHVPLMEHNCIEAIENNVFGTKVVLDLCEEFAVPRFMMVSTDKAVNPTNVMGATKRMCEMIAQAYSNEGTVKCSCTRFGNVLGSAGSVIPLFKRQIASGGPVTITDKRIIRYFMTIPEASQLVLQSGAMANDGELFVLDMGQPVKIMDLAENMIKLSGVQGVEIVETGLRPGEKLYEELLVKTEDLTKTDNSLIFIERDTLPTMQEIDTKLEILAKACKAGDDDTAREALRQVVPTFKRPEDVNKDIDEEVAIDEIHVDVEKQTATV